MPRGVIVDPPASPGGFIVRRGVLKNYKGLQQLIDDGIVIEFSQKAEAKVPAGTEINYGKDNNQRMVFEQLSEPVKTPKKKLIIKKEKGDFAKRVPRKAS